MDLSNYCTTVASQAKLASRSLAVTKTAAKNAWLERCAEMLVNHTDRLLECNRNDLDHALSEGLSHASIDRLTLTPDRIRSMSTGLRSIAHLPDPVGEVREGSLRPNSLQVLKIGVPLGVIFFIYESRPNVTTDAAGLCVKSGNAVILRGGKEAFHTNTQLVELLKQSLQDFELPQHAIQLVSTTDREAVGTLLKFADHIDLAIPRGGESLIRRVVAEARMPVLKHYQGICHVYVDVSASIEMAVRILTNSKCQRPGVCNAAEAVLVHSAISSEFFLRLKQSGFTDQVEIRGCTRTCQHVERSIPVKDADYATEHLAMVISCKVVDSVDEAIEHITRFGSGHTDAIVANDLSTVQTFVARVDSAAVIVNASTRFNDGYELGLGAEIGISTDKFHARGPCGLRELTSTKYVISGDGQIRE